MPAQITPGGPSDSSNDSTLTAVAREIHVTWERARQHQTAAWEAYFQTGRLLAEARAILSSDRDYGRWFSDQDFGFSTEWGRRLISVATHEDSIRGLLATAVARGDEPPGVNAALLAIAPPIADLDPHSWDGFKVRYAASMARLALLRVLLQEATTLPVIVDLINEADDEIAAWRIYNAETEQLLATFASGATEVAPPVAQP